MIINAATALISPCYRTLTIYDRAAPLNVGPQIPTRPKGEPQAATWAWCDDEGIDLRTASDTAPVAVTVILTDGGWGPVPPLWHAESIFSGPWGDQGGRDLGQRADRQQLPRARRAARGLPDQCLRGGP